MIKTTSIILSVLGLLWACVAWMGLLVPFAFLMAMIKGELFEGDWPFLLLGMQTYVGFFVWLGWIVRALDKKYILKRRVFWLVSYIHHFFWLVFPLIVNGASKGERKEVFVEEPWLLCYLVFVMIVSAIFTFIDKDKAEQVAVHNSVGCAHSM